MSHLIQSVKNRCSVRCDSSESCDSGLVCSDTSSCSSCSDVIEPISPSSSQSPRSDITEPVTKTDEPEAILPDILKPTDQPCGKIKQAFMIPEILIDHTQPIEIKTSLLSRKRRHSESLSAIEQNFGIEERHRRFSGDLAIKTSILMDDCRDILCPRSDFPSKRVNYENRKEEIESAIKSPFQNSCLRARMSWPLLSRRSLSEQTRNGQTKITEYFPNQVKQKWSFMKLCSASKRGTHKTLDVSSQPIPVTTPPLPNFTSSEDCKRLKVETRDSLCPPVQNFSDATPEPIRFPTLKPLSLDSKSQGSTDVPNEETFSRCKWLDCDAKLSLGQSLLEHIQTVHVAPQYRKNGWKPLLPKSPSSTTTSQGNNAANEVYVCQWEGCKVQGRCSSSRAWLERHVLLHGGNKPFRCIVDSCEQRFSSQVALQRHVNAHLNQGMCGANQTNVIKREINTKIARRNLKKLRNRISKVAPARLFDYFDAGIMERLRHQLLFSQLSQKQDGIVFVNGQVTVKSEVVARRLDECGKTRVLLRWHPENILPDQWVMEEEVLAYRTIPLHDLSHATKLHLQSMLNKPSGSTAGEKRRRK